MNFLRQILNYLSKWSHTNFEHEQKNLFSFFIQSELNLHWSQAIFN